MLAGRHQQLVATGDVVKVLADAPAKFDEHLRAIGKADDPESIALRDSLIHRLEEYLSELELFDNLSDYDEQFFNFLKEEKGLK